jgi:hypothetical protein
MKKFKLFLNILGIFQLYLFPLYLNIVLFIGGLFGFWSFSFQNALDFFLVHIVALVIVFLMFTKDLEKHPEKYERCENNASQ